MVSRTLKELKRDGYLKLGVKRVTLLKTLAARESQTEHRGTKAQRRKGKKRNLLQLVTTPPYLLPLSLRVLLEGLERQDMPDPWVTAPGQHLRISSLHG